MSESVLRRNYIPVYVSSGHFCGVSDHHKERFVEEKVQIMKENVFNTVIFIDFYSHLYSFNRFIG